ncbi:MAG: hypothetical protein LBN29_13505, partial [Mediterranea sp.]|nr:hypothetical protein [Mediterranea sp.]
KVSYFASEWIGGREREGLVIGGREFTTDYTDSHRFCNDWHVETVQDKHRFSLVPPESSAKRRRFERLGKGRGLYAGIERHPDADSLLLVLLRRSVRTGLDGTADG